MRWMVILIIIVGAFVVLKRRSGASFTVLCATEVPARLDDPPGRSNHSDPARNPAGNQRAGRITAFSETGARPNLKRIEATRLISVSAWVRVRATSVRPSGCVKHFDVFGRLRGFARFRSFLE
jgi:hypothetical protein